MMHFALQREMPGPGVEMVIVEVLKGPINMVMSVLKLVMGIVLWKRGLTL